MEIKQENTRNILVCGMYREWSSEGLLTMNEQLEAIKIMTNQIEAADMEKKNKIVMGDVNIYIKECFVTILKVLKIKQH